MRVLVTGAFGNIGKSTIKELLERGHQIRCFDLKTKANERSAGKFKGKIEIVWGDLRNPDDTARAVQGQNVVIHLAFVIPKLSATGVGCEDQPTWAWGINIGGTRNLIDAMRALEKPPKLLFTSSLHIYGITKDRPPPRTTDDPLKPMEHYARHKVECEHLVRESGLHWAIFRLAAALPFSLTLDQAMFEVPLDNRMEYVHNQDVGLALAKAVNCDAVWGKVLHIGGGPRCHYLYRDIIEQVLNAVGVGMLPETAFGLKPFSTDWIDTTESERILKYQRYTISDFAKELSSRLGFRRYLVLIFRPLVRSLLLRGRGRDYTC